MSNSNTHADVWIAGAVAAFTVDLLVFPLDTLKTRLQSRNYAQLYTDSTTRAVNRKLLFRGLYQGVGSVIIATLPSSGAFFTTYEAVKAGLTRVAGADGSTIRIPGTTTSISPLHLPQPIIHSAASSVGELVSCAILTPAEVIKQNAQMVTHSTSSRQPTTNATLQTLSRFRSNPLALWRGYTALAGRNLPFTALQFPMFERLRSALRDRRRRHNARQGKAVARRKADGASHGLSLVENGLITAVSAGLAGSVAAVVTTPIDVVKTRIMLAAAEDAPAASASASSASRRLPAGALVNALGQTVKSTAATATAAVSRPSFVQIGREIVAENGARGLWRGGGLRAVWTMVGSGLYLGAYESVRARLAMRRGEDVAEAAL